MLTVNNKVSAFFILRLTLHFYRYVIAEGFFCHVVAMYRIGPGPASSADIDVLTLATFPLVGFEIAQVAEYLGILPDLAEGGFFDVAGGTVEVGAGFDVAETVDQADGLGGDAAFAPSGGESQRAALEFAPLGLGLLGERSGSSAGRRWGA